MPLQSFTNTFAGNPLDRVSERRSEAGWIEEKLKAPGSLAIALWNGKPLLESAKDGGSQLAYLSASVAGEIAGGPERLLFLGLWKETAVFAVDLESESDPADEALSGLGRFEDLRAVVATLPGADAAIIATAKAMFEWRRRHRFCANCGQPSETMDGGWKRLCRACGTQHFPRTDPVTIMLPVHGERCLLGRQKAWPAQMMSALAGFLEPGESIEEGCARELWEEARLKAVRVRYHSTQPWPYPSSLMIGLIAEVESDEATADGIEIDTVRWFTREEARAILAGTHPEVKAPPGMAIAHQLIRAWAETA